MPRYLVTTIPAGDLVGAIVAVDPVEAARQAERNLGGDGSHDFRDSARIEVEETGGYAVQKILDHIDIEPVRRGLANYRAWLRANDGIPSWVLRVPVTTH